MAKTKRYKRTIRRNRRNRKGNKTRRYKRSNIKSKSRHSRSLKTGGWGFSASANSSYYDRLINDEKKDNAYGYLVGGTLVGGTLVGGTLVGGNWGSITTLPNV